MGLILSSNGPNLPFEILVSCRPVLFPAFTLYRWLSQAWLGKAGLGYAIWMLSAPLVMADKLRKFKPESTQSRFSIGPETTENTPRIASQDLPPG